MNIYERALKYAVEQTVHEDMFPVVWHLIEQYPSAVAIVDLLAIRDGMDRMQEQEVIDVALEAGIADRLVGDFQQEIAAASAQLAAFGLEIVEVEQVGYRIRSKQQAE